MKMKDGAHSPYLQLLVMALLSFLSMYALMYAMVDVFANVYSSLNQVYMAGLMTAPMLVIELVLMRHMYPNGALNAVVVATSVVALAAFFLLIRQQAMIGNTQFLRSMIPHHAGAILMCTKAPIDDDEIKRLCDSIKAGQQSEIDQMKTILSRLENQ
jgi:hypothetical protein